VGSITHRKIVPLDRAREAFTDCHPGDINEGTLFEQVHPNFAARLELLALAIRKAELPKPATNLDRDLRELSAFRLGDAIPVLPAGGDLYGSIAVAFRRFYAHDAIGFNFHNGHRDGSAFFCVHACHAQLASN
jgi:hypothetical protein